jgi:hypothetical protein
MVRIWKEGHSPVRRCFFPGVFFCSWYVVTKCRRNDDLGVSEYDQDFGLLFNDGSLVLFGSVITLL